MIYAALFSAGVLLGLMSSSAIHRMVWRKKFGITGGTKPIKTIAKTYPSLWLKLRTELAVDSVRREDLSPPPS